MSTSIRNLAGAGLAISSLLFPISSFGDSSSVIVKDADDEAEDTGDFLGKTFGVSGGDPIEVGVRIGHSQITPDECGNLVGLEEGSKNQGGTTMSALNGHVQEMDTELTRDSKSKLQEARPRCCGTCARMSGQRVVAGFLRMLESNMAKTTSNSNPQTESPLRSPFTTAKPGAAPCQAFRCGAR